VSTIGKGLHVLCGITHSDTVLDVESLIPKLLKLKLWSSEDGKAWMNSITDMNYQIMLVS
jgi:D-Tyr-tRNAtyr deacylase